MSHRHLKEAIAEEEAAKRATGPTCLACGGEDIRAVYLATVIQPVQKWSTTQPGEWSVEEFGTADIEFEGEIADERLECFDCGARVGERIDGPDTYRLIEPAARSTPPVEAAMKARRIITVEDDEAACGSCSNRGAGEYRRITLQRTVITICADCAEHLRFRLKAMAS